jgi:hypothetical protein
VSTPALSRRFMNCGLDGLTSHDSPHFGGLRWA